MGDRRALQRQVTRYKTSIFLLMLLDVFNVLVGQIVLALVGYQEF